MQNYKRRQYTDEFKQEAVRMVTDRGYSASDTANRLGINTNMLRRWKRQAEESSHGVFSGNGRRSEEQEELIRLRKEVKRLRMEREILKKRWASLPANRIKVRLYGRASRSVADHRVV